MPKFPNTSIRGRRAADRAADPLGIGGPSLLPASDPAPGREHGADGLAPDAAPRPRTPDPTRSAGGADLGRGALRDEPNLRTDLSPASRIEAECLTLVGPDLRRMLVVGVLLNIVAVLGLWGNANTGRLLLWSAMVLGASVVLAFVAGAKPVLDIESAVRARRRELTTSAGNVGVAWALGVFVVVPSAHGNYRAIVVIAAIAALSSMSLGTLLVRNAFLALVVPIVAALSGRFAFGVGADRSIAAMTLVAGGAFVAHALAANRNAITLVRNRIENELLTRKLAKAAELRSLMQGELDRIAEDTERENDADALTGAKNRRAFLETVAEHWQRAESGYDPFTLVIIDIDQYDEIQKSHGADVGNELLKQVSAVIDKGLRTDDSLARLNDSQFAVLLNNALNDGAVICLERIRRKVSAHPFDAGEPLLISVSAGIATWEKGLGMRQLLSRADTSLRRARDEGGNQLSVWGDSLHTIAT